MTNKQLQRSKPGMFYCIQEDLNFALFSKLSQYVKGHCTDGETNKRNYYTFYFKMPKKHFLNGILNLGKNPKPNQKTTPHTRTEFVKFNLIHLHSDLLKFIGRGEAHASMVTKLLPKAR